MNKKGFTLIEVLVSVSIFALVMLVATGAVFSIVAANKKTHSLKSVMTNLNFALESIARDMRLGSSYSCNGAGDCTGSNGTSFSFQANRDVDGDGNSVNDNIELSLSNGHIRKRVLGGTYPSDYYITADEIIVESLKFYLIGSGPTDGLQPKVVMTIQGYAGVGQTRSNFNIQTMVSQRAIDS